jgi:thymidylate synthase (FAD)
MRATEHADVEIRRVAIECLRQLQTAAPNVFGDYEIVRRSDGSEVAVSSFAAE